MPSDHDPPPTTGLRVNREAASISRGGRAVRSDPSRLSPPIGVTTPGPSLSERANPDRQESLRTGRERLVRPASPGECGGSFHRRSLDLDALDLVASGGLCCWTEFGSMRQRRPRRARHPGENGCLRAGDRLPPAIRRPGSEPGRPLATRLRLGDRPPRVGNRRGCARDSCQGRAG
jgi:hypothetical protein